MKYFKLVIAVVLFISAMSCGQTGQTNQQDNVTHSNDTMVIKQNQTDSATKTISTDTTKR